MTESTNCEAKTSSVDQTSHENTPQVVAHPATKEKMRNIMEAASALTSLGDEEDSVGSTTAKSPETVDKTTDDNSVEAKEGIKPCYNAEENDDKNSNGAPKRFLPDHKKPDAAPTFPEKLMKMMRYCEKQKEGFFIAWCEDGKSFIIRNPDEFARYVIPKYFKATKFSSFTRKLYRWGFRQINRGIGPDDPIIFGNEYFQRNDESLIAKMRSVTAASARKTEQSRVVMIGGGGTMKRAFDEPFSEDGQKRMLLDQLFHQQKHMGMMNPNVNLYGGINPNGSITLSNAIRPGLGFGGPTPGMNPNMIAPPNGNNSIMINQMNPQFMQPPYHMPSGQYNPTNGSSYPNPQSTAEIVNAAITALRHAN